MRQPITPRAHGVLDYATSAAVATATAEGIRRVAEATRMPGGAEAIQLKVAEQYIHEFGKVINNADTIILPSNVADVAAMITTAISKYCRTNGTTTNRAM